MSRTPLPLVAPEEAANLKSFFMTLSVLMTEHALVPERAQKYKRGFSGREQSDQRHSAFLIQHYAACPFCWMDAHPEKP